MANRSDVRAGQRWARKGDALSYRVITESVEEGAPVQLSGPGPLRGVIEVDREELLRDWLVQEPTMEETCDLIDRCVRVTMKENDWLNCSAQETTEHLRKVLDRAQGSLPSWMSPEFWTVEHRSVSIPSSSTVRAQSRGLSLVPTCLVGKRVEFYPVEASMRATLPDENLFVVGTNHIDALIGLARLVQAKMESTSGTTP